MEGTVRRDRDEGEGREKEGRRGEDGMDEHEGKGWEKE
jgi:hypothetical protein